MAMKCLLEYDAGNPRSIEEYAKRLIGKTFQMYVMKILLTM